MRSSLRLRFTSLSLALLLAGATLPLAAQKAPAPPQPAAAPVVASPWSGASQAAQAAIAKANDLVQAGKWNSAWAVLEAADAKNADPYILALKTDICLRGYVRTELHQSFSLVDLGQGQTLAALRADSGEYAGFSFDPVAAAGALEAAGTAIPAVLSGALGDYFYEVQNLYPGAWVLSDEEACQAGLDRYEAAARGGVASALQLQRRGELLIRFTRLDEAEEVLRQSIALDPANADAHFAYALAYGQGGKMAEAAAELDKAIAAYSDEERRFNAYLFGARMLAGNDDAKSEAYLKAAEKAYPEEPAPALVRHLIALQSGDGAAVMAKADAAQDRFPESPYVVRSLLSSWLQAGDLDGAMAWIDHATARMAGKDASLGVLAFYKSLLVAQSAGAEGLKEAISLLDAAEASFRKVYAPDNQAFEAIAEMRQQYAQALEQAVAEESAAGDGAADAAPATGAAPAADAASSATK